MKNGFKIVWTEHALSELEKTIEFLEKNWTERELRIFATKLDHTIELISKSPELFPSSLEKSDIRKAVVEKHNNLYYRINDKSIEIISLFSNRQNPKNKRI
ncbi:type II toxin-antitoxin system RelE/ParE family toxin [Psychroserpens mesophilus]|uniref:type II toxin-antitoxin system RelE/ParE family toxin n=1 Tax=Psychroserpens mesophilus TaxID=325473 RepID=UPI003D64C223